MALSKRHAAYKRQQEALELQLKDLKAEGDDRLSSKNDAIAGNQTAWEMGEFDNDVGDPIPEFTDDMMKGFIVRTRSDVISVRLNTVDMVNRIREIERKVERLSVAIYGGLGILIVLAFRQFPWW